MPEIGGAFGLSVSDHAVRSTGLYQIENIGLKNLPGAVNVEKLSEWTRSSSRTQNNTTVTNSERNKMVRSRLGLKVLGLCALALGLMAFVAGAAQAESASHWNVAGKSVTGSEEFQGEIKEIENKSATLEFTTLGGTLVKILCTAAKFTEGGKLVKEGGLSLGKISFTGCKVELNSKAAAACEAHSTGKPVGTIETLKGKGLITLDVVSGKSEDYTKITPDEGTTFAIIEMGEECAIGTKVEVKAKAAGEGLWIKDGGGNTGFTTSAATHLILEALKGLIALGQPAVIEGSAVVALTGGASWSGTPG